MGKVLSYLKNWSIGVNYCWIYGPSKLLVNFIEYRLDQLNKKHTKIAGNSTMQYFEGSSQNKCLLKVWIFGPPTTKWWACNFQTSRILDIWFNENAQYESKAWFANNKFNLLRWNTKYFSWFFKGFQLPDIVSDRRLRFYLY